MGVLVSLFGIASSMLAFSAGFLLLALRIRANMNPFQTQQSFERPGSPGAGGTRAAKGYLYKRHGLPVRVMHWIKGGYWEDLGYQWYAGI